MPVQLNVADFIAAGRAGYNREARYARREWSGLNVSIKLL